MASVTRDQARDYYEDFSLAAGVRDWMSTNPRHEQLKILVDDLLEGRRNLRIADVGCGAGVMTDHLRRYGEVVGVDFSSKAIDAARRFSARRVGRQVAFVVGSLEALPAETRYDLVTLFDVLEHIPRTERRAFLADLRNRLGEGGSMFASTPYPAFTRSRRQVGDDTLQIIDEEVDLSDVIDEAASVGLQLVRYWAYDVFAGSPEYQAMVFTTARVPGGRAELRDPRLDRRLSWLQRDAGRRALKVARAARLVSAGQRGVARKLLTGVPPQVRS